MEYYITLFVSIFFFFDAAMTHPCRPNIIILIVGRTSSIYNTDTIKLLPPTPVQRK